MSTLQEISVRAQPSCEKQEKRSHPQVFEGRLKKAEPLIAQEPGISPGWRRHAPLRIQL